MNEVKILIVLLNWNGSLDTLDCCKSLNKIKKVCHGATDVLIIDNNSSVESFEVLSSGLHKLFGNAYELKITEEITTTHHLSSLKSFGSFFLVRSDINHGFSQGCNIGAKYAKEKGYEYILFLNNDTVVEPDFLDLLLNSINNADAVIPQIRYYHDKNLIWNCGGKISKFGARKYYYANKHIENVVFPSDIFPITFATGCCILFRTQYFNDIGLFSNKFFFGEEDIELALRLNKSKAKVVCDTRSIIYHKVGASIQGDGEKILRKAYIHYLNRFVNMKFHLGKLWYIWLIPSSVKVFINLISINKQGLFTSIYIIKKLLADSMKLAEVNKEKFESILKCGIK